MVILLSDVELLFTFALNLKNDIMDWLAYPLADIIVWTFDNLLVPLGELTRFGIVNTALLILGFVLMIFWLGLQHKYNKAAEADANQLK